jgi:hypothetical protein
MWWTEEHSLRVLENKVLRKIFGPEREEITGAEKTTQREDSSPVLLTKYCSIDQINKN